MEQNIIITSMYKNFKSRGRFSKMDIYKCPFSENGGRDLKKTMKMSLRA
jgi:hypothetical protein